MARVFCAGARPMVSVALQDCLLFRQFEILLNFCRSREPVGTCEPQVLEVLFASAASNHQPRWLPDPLQF